MGRFESTVDAYRLTFSISVHGFTLKQLTEEQSLEKISH